VNGDVSWLGEEGAKPAPPKQWGLTRGVGGLATPELQLHEDSGSECRICSTGVSTPFNPFPSANGWCSNKVSEGT